jgi:predicted SprT family Zn-dependent metalloprotease
MKNKLNNLQTFEQHTIEKNDKESTKIEVVCSDCGKKFKTTQAWFDVRNKDGKLPCRKCRFSKFPPKKEKPAEDKPAEEKND